MVRCRIIVGAWVRKTETVYPWFQESGKMQIGSLRNSSPKTALRGLFRVTAIFWRFCIVVKMWPWKILRTKSAVTIRRFRVPGKVAERQQDYLYPAYRTRETVWTGVWEHIKRIEWTSLPRFYGGRNGHIRRAAEKNGEQSLLGANCRWNGTGYAVFHTNS